MFTLQVLPKTKQRVINTYFIAKENKLRFWDGSRPKCLHKDEVKKCKKDCADNLDIVQNMISMNEKTVKLILKNKEIIINHNHEIVSEIELEQEIEDDIKELSEEDKKILKELDRKAIPEVKTKDRINGVIYRQKNGKISIWKTDNSKKGGHYECMHNEVLSRCKKCPDGGKNYCNIHIGKRKDNCLCAKCKHGNQKLTCNDCYLEKKKKLKCPHGLYRASDCPDCDGTNICKIHKVRYRICEDCGTGSGICQEHRDVITGKKRRKERCVQCLGREVCPHQENTKYKDKCNICTPERKHMCQECKKVRIEESIYKPLCYKCFYDLNPNEIKSRNYKAKETFIYEYLKRKYTKREIIREKVVGLRHLKPDYLIKRKNYNIIGECDEDAHRRYNAQVEEMRLTEIKEGLENKPLVVIRINPDKNSTEEGCFKFENGKIMINNEKIWLKRRRELVKNINKYLKEKPDRDLTLIMIGFD